MIAIHREDRSSPSRILWSLISVPVRHKHSKQLIVVTIEKMAENKIESEKKIINLKESIWGSTTTRVLLIAVADSQPHTDELSIPN